MIKLANTKEAAAILRISPLHVRRLLRQGKLSGQKVGRDWVMFEPSGPSNKYQPDPRD